MSQTAAWPVDVAMEVYAAQDAPLAALLGAPDTFRWYAPPVPQGAGFPRVTNDDAAEDGLPLFNGSGQHNVRTLSIWAKGKTGKRTVLEIWGHLFRLFDEALVPVEGFGTLRTTARLVITVPEPDTGVHHGITEVQIWTR